MHYYFLIIINRWLTDTQFILSALHTILEFVKRELTTTEGVFYASLDADSLTEIEELEEGAFYVWKYDEIVDILGVEESRVFSPFSFKGIQQRTRTSRINGRRFRSQARESI